MVEKEKYLEKEGSFDYDYVNDILFLKVNGREYAFSIELSDYVIDLDTEGFVVGLQIFNASSYFGMAKGILREVKNWKLEARIKDRVIEVKLLFSFCCGNEFI
jgi:uncharacterized protein YuzE